MQKCERYSIWVYDPIAHEVKRHPVMTLTTTHFSHGCCDTIEFNKVEYVTLRDASLQSPTYHTAGYFLNSLDRQLTEELEASMSEELGFKIGIKVLTGGISKEGSRQTMGIS